MSISSALIAYFLTAFLSLGIPVFAFVVLYKKKRKPDWFNLLLGMLGFIVVLAVYFLILKFHLSSSGAISDYFNTASYRVVIISLISVIVTVLLWVFATLIYIKRQNSVKCISFFAGFGCSGTVLIGLYSFAMLLLLMFKISFSSFVAFDDSVKAFVFSDDVYVSVFTPIFGHVSYGIALLSFLVCMTLLGISLARIGKRQLPFWTSIFAFLGFVVGITALIDFVVFSKMFSMKHYVVAILSIIIALWCLLLTWATGHFVKKTKDQSYTKQFN